MFVGVYFIMKGLENSIKIFIWNNYDDNVLYMMKIYKDKIDYVVEVKMCKEDF